MALADVSNLTWFVRTSTIIAINILMNVDLGRCTWIVLLLVALIAIVPNSKTNYLEDTSQESMDKEEVTIMGTLKSTKMNKEEATVIANKTNVITPGKQTINK